MSAPLQGAGYLRPPKRLGTKEEVLTMLKQHVANGQPSDGLSRSEKMADKVMRLYELSVWRANTFAGPHWVLTGPIRPVEYVEERFRNFIGHYGQVRND
jgi:hypothetical protein